MNKKALTKKYKASVLVVTMIILGLILLSTLSMTLVSLQERKASMGDVRSQQVFQNAQTGAELVMDAIMRTRSDNPTETVDNIDFDCDSDGHNAILSTSGDSTYAVELKKFSYDPLVPITYTHCNSTVSEVVSLKSVGIGAGQRRAIEAAVPTPVTP